MARFRAAHDSGERASSRLRLGRRLLVEAESGNHLRGRLRFDARSESAEVSAILLRRLVAIFLITAPFAFGVRRLGAALDRVESGGKPPHSKGERWVERTLRSMTLDEKIGQMLMPGTPL